MNWRQVDWDKVQEYINKEEKRIQEELEKFLSKNSHLDGFAVIERLFKPTQIALSIWIPMERHTKVGCATRYIRTVGKNVLRASKIKDEDIQNIATFLSEVMEDLKIVRYGKDDGSVLQYMLKPKYEKFLT
jgi:hypothetical protein